MLGRRALQPFGGSSVRVRPRLPQVQLHGLSADGWQDEWGCKGYKDPKGPTGPDLKYQTSSQHSDNQSKPHDDLTSSDYLDIGLTMAFSMHYIRVSDSD
jgi:hypothetical protein